MSVNAASEVEIVPPFSRSVPVVKANAYFDALVDISSLIGGALA